MRYLIGIDNGGTAIKTVVFDEGGNEIASSSNKTPLEVPQSGYNERDMELLWKLTAECIGNIISGADINPLDIAAVGCTGHGKGAYLWGKDNKPAYKGIASTDRRAQKIVDEWNRNGTARAARKISMQDIYVSQPVALLRWFKEKKPEVLQNTKWIFEAKDYIRYMLTGEAYAEVTDYSGTGMMNLHNATFDKRLFELFGIQEVMEKLPPLKYSCDICGYITETASRETEIPKGVPVCGGMFDIDACGIAMGANADDDICVITGTWAINEYVSDRLVEGKTLGNTYFCQPDKYLVDSSSPASAGNLEWFIERFASDELKPGGRPDYEKINWLVREADSEKNQIVFLPFLYGSNKPTVNKACFWGMDNFHTEGDLLRAIYEGVAFCHMNHIECLLAHRQKPKYLKLAGGVANSDVWVQIFADLSGYPVKIIHTRELGGLGCAIACAVSAGIYKDMDEGVLHMVHVEKIIEPDFKNGKILRKRYKNYNKLIAALGSVEWESEDE